MCFSGSFGTKIGNQLSWAWRYLAVTAWWGQTENRPAQSLVGKSAAVPHKSESRGLCVRPD